MVGQRPIGGARVMLSELYSWMRSLEWQVQQLLARNSQLRSDSGELSSALHDLGSVADAQQALFARQQRSFSNSALSSSHAAQMLRSRLEETLSSGQARSASIIHSEDELNGKLFRIEQEMSDNEAALCGLRSQLDALGAQIREEEIALAAGGGTDYA